MKKSRRGKSISNNTDVKVEPASVSILHYERMMRLAKAAVEHLPGLVLWAEENRNSIGYGMDSKLEKFNREYAAFKEQKTETDQLKFLMGSPLGIYLFLSI